MAGLPKPLGPPDGRVPLAAAMGRAAPPGGQERNLLRHARDALRTADWLTPERALRWGVGFLVLSLVMLGAHVVNHTTHGITDGRGAELGNDFINFWSGAHLAAAGQAPLAYVPHHFQAFEQALTGPSSSWRIYVYPPVMLLLSLPLAALSFVPALALWTLLGAASCVGLLRLLCGWRAAIILSLGAPAAALDLFSGQNGHFTAAFLAGGLMLLDPYPMLAGMCFGCLAYKPQMALLLPFALAAGGNWRAFAAAAATAAALVLASAALFGAAAWAGFFAELATQRQLLETYANFWHRMPTVFAALRLLGAAPAPAYAAQLVSAGLALAAVIRAWRGAAPPAIKAAALLVATFLATPHAFDYDETVLVFAAAWWAREAAASGFRRWEKLALAALLAAPLPAMVVAKLGHLPLAPVVLWLGFAVLMRRADAGSARSGTPR